MSSLQSRIRCGHGEPPGGIDTCSAEEIQSDIAFIAYHFHWPHSEVLDLEHVRRRAFINQISRINRLLREGGE
ncbi:DUF6760 family protein [Streptomyces vinaceus]